MLQSSSQAVAGRSEDEFLEQFPLPRRRRRVRVSRGPVLI